MKYIQILFISAMIFACEQQHKESTKSQNPAVDTLRFGNFYGTSFYRNITTLELQNADSSHLFKLIKDSTHNVRIELGKLKQLDLQLISKNKNVSIKKIDANNFELTVNDQFTEPNSSNGLLALLNTYESSGYVLIRRDTTINSKMYTESQPFTKLDTIVHYELKIE
ncbi:MAG: hypothetical protein ACJA2S_005553 [Cyclobacteriaceae bacterium]|jgi:hypothetical protein